MKETSMTPVGVREALEEARDLLMERRQGNPARSPAHNARLLIEQALAAFQPPEDVEVRERTIDVVRREVGSLLGMATAQSIAERVADRLAALPQQRAEEWRGRPALVKAMAEKLWGYNAYIERLWVPDPTAPYEGAVKWNEDAAQVIASAMLDVLPPAPSDPRLETAAAAGAEG